MKGRAARTRVTSGRAAVYGAARPRASGFLRRRRRRGLQTTPPSRTDIRQQAALASFSGSPCRLDGLSGRRDPRTSRPLHHSDGAAARAAPCTCPRLLSRARMETRVPDPGFSIWDRLSCDYIHYSYILLHSLSGLQLYTKTVHTSLCFGCNSTRHQKSQYSRHVPTFVLRS